MKPLFTDAASRLYAVCEMTSLPLWVTKSMQVTRIFERNLWQSASAEPFPVGKANEYLWTWEYLRTQAPGQFSYANSTKF